MHAPPSRATAEGFASRADPAAGDAVRSTDRHRQVLALQRTAGNRATVQRIFGIQGVSLPHEEDTALTKWLLFYGCGDFAEVGGYVDAVLTHRHVDTLDDSDIVIVATELRVLDRLRDAYGNDVERRIVDLARKGVDVRLGVDATNHPMMGKFDEIVFQGVHAGVYGSDIRTAGACISANDVLFRGFLTNAHRHIAPRGRLVARVSGWPFVGERTDLHLRGLDLGNRSSAEAYGGLQWTLRSIRTTVMQTSRTGGGSFASEGVVLEFEDNLKWRDFEELVANVVAYDGSTYPYWVATHPDLRLANVRAAPIIAEQNERLRARQPAGSAHAVGSPIGNTATTTTAPPPALVTVTATQQGDDDDVVAVVDGDDVRNYARTGGYDRLA